MWMQTRIQLLDIGNMIIILLICTWEPNLPASKRRGGQRDHGLINLLISQPTRFSQAWTQVSWPGPSMGSSLGEGARQWA